MARLIDADKLLEHKRIMYSVDWTGEKQEHAVSTDDIEKALIVDAVPAVQNDIKERTLVYLYKRIKKARIDIGKAEHKKGAAREIEGLTNKIHVLEYLTELVLREDERR